MLLKEKLMVTTMLGYATGDWHDIAALFQFTEGRDPTHFVELQNYWDNNRPRTPRECLEIASKLIEARRTYKSAAITNILTHFASAVGLSQ